MFTVKSSVLASCCADQVLESTSQALWFMALITGVVFLHRFDLLEKSVDGNVENYNLDSEFNCSCASVDLGLQFNSQFAGD